MIFRSKIQLEKCDSTVVAPKVPHSALMPGTLALIITASYGSTFKGSDFWWEELVLLWCMIVYLSIVCEFMSYCICLRYFLYISCIFLVYIYIYNLIIYSRFETFWLKDDTLWSMTETPWVFYWFFLNFLWWLDEGHLEQWQSSADGTICQGFDGHFKWGYSKSLLTERNAQQLTRFSSGL